MEVDEFWVMGGAQAVGALAYGTVLGETHHATRTPLDPLAIAKNYLALIADRRFVVPAATPGKSVIAKLTPVSSSCASSKGTTLSV